MQKMMIKLIPIALCFMVVVAALVLAFLSWTTVSDSNRAEGTVISMKSATDGAGEAPVVEYQAEGKTYWTSGTAFTTYSAYSVGEKVTVLYKHEHPGEATINSFTELWFLPTVLGGMGLIGLLISWLVLLRNRRFDRRWKEIEANPERAPELMRLIEKMREINKEE